jgi:acyl-CoA dehydrogenase
LTRFSSAFALLADVTMLTMGGGLKRREKISARLGDILSQLYLMSATIKRFESEGRHAADAPLMNWAVWDAMYKTQMAIDGVLANFPNRFIAWWLERIIFPYGHPYVVPSDRVGHQVAKALINPSATRDRLTAEAYTANGLDPQESPVAALEQAFAATLQAEEIEAKIREAEKAGKFGFDPKANVRDIAHVAFERGAITADEYAIVRRRNELRDIVIRVDDFPMDCGVSVRRESDDLAPPLRAAA